MAATKAELESDYQRYRFHLAAATDDEKSLNISGVLRHCREALEYIDGMMQFGRRYLDQQFESVETIDLTIQYAPLFLDSDSLDQVERLLDDQRRIEKHTLENTGARVRDARMTLQRVYKLLNFLEMSKNASLEDLYRKVNANRRQINLIVELLERIGIIKRTSTESAFAISLVTDMDENFRAKCGSCGVMVKAAKTKLLEPRACPKCAVVSPFVLLMAIENRG